MSKASIKHGGLELFQGLCNLVKAVVRFIVFGLAAIGLYFLLGTTDIIDHLQLKEGVVMKRPPIFDYGGE